MEISAKVIADSRAPCGARLATMVWTYPRRIHSEIMTHRMLTKSSASSRAIPQDRMLAMIEADPCLPISWGKNQSGMQQGEDVDETTALAAEGVWLRARDNAIHSARAMQKLGLHKQIGNRLTEPFMWITVIVSATEWDNVWGLRCHPAAEPHFQDLARKARTALEASEPRMLGAGEWHLPFIDDEDMQPLRDYIHPHREYHNNVSTLAKAARELAVKVSMARCARVSYLNHEGKRDIGSDLALFDKLVGSDPKHAAPSEHVAQALDWPKWYRDLGPDVDKIFEQTGFTVYNLRELVVSRRNKRHESGKLPGMGDLYDEACLGELQSGNYLGFRQFRKTLKNENIGGLMP